MSTATTSIDAIRHLPDVEDRAREASRIAKTAAIKSKVERTRRDGAAVVLARKYGELPIRVAELGQFSRGLMFRMLDRVADGDVDKIAETFPTAPDARKAVEKSGKAVRKWDMLAEEAREVRDDAVEKMLASPQWRNADVARITGLTTARIAQMRQGRR